MQTREQIMKNPAKTFIWRNVLVGAMVGAIGITLVIGGTWLLSLGGSWYYALAGVALFVSAVQLIRGRRSGAWWYFAVLAATSVWTLWESGLDYWGWIPRVGLFVLMGIAVAGCMPTLFPHTLRRVWMGIGAALGVVLLAAIGLAFAPHNVTGPYPDLIASASPAPGSADTLPDSQTQPANDPAPSDWAAYGRSQAGLRYSPLKQITPDNVATLTKVWEFHTGDVPKKLWGAETTPLKIGDRIYLCSARNILIALDASTGKEIWRYDPKVADKSIPYTAACRGVAFYDASKATPASVGNVSAAPPSATAQSISDAQGKQDDSVARGIANSSPDGTCTRRIIEGTLDARLIAVDADTGKPCQDFGQNGQVDITTGMGEVPPGYVSINSVPVIVRGVIVTGHQVLDGQSRWAPSGVILGYDVINGNLRWAWDMVHPERHGLPPAGETYARGTPNMWTNASGDEKLGLVYLPLAAPAGQYVSQSRRPEENAYSDSLVALDVSTGTPTWHFQSQTHGVWDYDLGSQPSLIDFPTDSGSVPALLLPTKQGDLYVLDRRTGQPLTGVEQRPVPSGGVEPEQRSRTQPFSTYHTLRKADLTARSMWGLTPIDQLACRIQFQQANYAGIYTPPSADHPWIEYPGYNGGPDWGSVAIDPIRGVVVSNYNDIPNYDRMVPRAVAQAKDWKTRAESDVDNKAGPQTTGFVQQETPWAYTINAGWRLGITKMPCKEPPYGGIRAISLKTGKTLWDRPLGTARRNGPFGFASHLPVTMGTPNNGGSVVTAGGLIFIAAATDDLIRAIDLDTGKTLWHAPLPAGGQATPIVYAVEGRQYLVIVAAGHHFMETPAGDAVIAYALPQ